MRSRGERDAVRGDRGRNWGSLAAVVRVALVVAARAEAARFVALYERYFGPVHRYVRMRVPERAANEDVTSDVFLTSSNAASRCTHALASNHSCAAHCSQSLPQEREDSGGESHLNYTIRRIRLKGGRLGECSRTSPEEASQLPTIRGLRLL